MLKTLVLPQPFLSFPEKNFSPPPRTVGDKGMTRIGVLTTSTDSRDPLLRGETLLWESPVRWSYAHRSRADLADGRVCPLGISTDECKLNYRPFSFQSGYLRHILSASASGVTLNNRRKHFPVPEVEFCTVFITCEMSGAWLLFVSHHPE